MTELGSIGLRKFLASVRAGRNADLTSMKIDMNRIHPVVTVPNNRWLSRLFKKGSEITINQSTLKAIMMLSQGVRENELARYELDDPLNDDTFAQTASYTRGVGSSVNRLMTALQAYKVFDMRVKEVPRPLAGPDGQVPLPVYSDYFKKLKESLNNVRSVMNRFYQKGDSKQDVSQEPGVHILRAAAVSYNINSMLTEALNAALDREEKLVEEVRRQRILSHTYADRAYSAEMRLRGIEEGAYEGAVKEAEVKTNSRRDNRDISVEPELEVNRRARSQAVQTLSTLVSINQAYRVTETETDQGLHEALTTLVNEGRLVDALTKAAGRAI